MWLEPGEPCGEREEGRGGARELAGHLHLTQCDGEPREEVGQGKEGYGLTCIWKGQWLLEDC